MIRFFPIGTKQADWLLMSRYFYLLGISSSYLYQPLSFKSLCIHNYEVAFVSKLYFRTQILKTWFLIKVVFSLNGSFKALHCYSSNSQLDVGYRNIPSRFMYLDWCVVWCTKIQFYSWNILHLQGQWKTEEPIAEAFINITGFEHFYCGLGLRTPVIVLVSKEKISAPNTQGITHYDRGLIPILIRRF